MSVKNYHKWLIASRRDAEVAIDEVDASWYHGWAAGWAAGMKAAEAKHRVSMDKSEDA